MIENQLTSFHTYFYPPNATSESGLFVQKTAGGFQNCTRGKKVFGFSASGSEQTIVSAVTAKKIVVVTFDIGAASAASIYFKTGTSAALTYDFPLAAGEKFGRFFNPDGWFETVAGEALTAIVTGNPVGGFISYILTE